MEARNPNGRKWTQEEIKFLTDHWAEASIPVICTKLNRSVHSVLCKAGVLQLGGVSRGTKSLRELERETGYSLEKLKNACRHLNLSLRRARSYKRGRSTKGRFAIDIDQEETLMEFLKKHPDGQPIYRKDSKKTPKGIWGIGIKPAVCEDCKRCEKPHYARGLCSPCYQKRAKAHRKTALA